MRKAYKTAALLITGALLLSGCSSFEPQHKTETVTENVTSGIFPQIIEKSVSYVQETKDGEWKEESSETVRWDLADDLNIQDSVWVMSSKDATALYSGLDSSLKDVPATVYFHFGNDLKDVRTTVASGDNGTQEINVQLDMTGDLVFEAQGGKFCFYGVKIVGANIQADGATELVIDYGEGEGIITVPSDVKSTELKNYRIKQSDTYIKTVSFEDIPTFDITSSNVNGGVWDNDIANLSCGSNMSPELTWEAVEGATKYQVIIIDGGWLHMDVLTEGTSLAAGSIGKDGSGSQYVGPYPPAGSTHTYTVFVFALKGDADKVPMSFDKGSNSVDKIYEGLNGSTGNVLAYARLDGNFTNLK